MELDWYSDEDLLNTTKFNENSVINKEKKKIINIEQNFEIENKNNDIDNCFKINLIVNDSKSLLYVLNYLSLVSNHLRTLMRNKSSKFNEFSEITKIEFDIIIKYLTWLLESCNSIKNFFAVPLRKDNSFDPNTIKLFKTSSYKFCNFKELCSIHRNKSKCDKNHFVFDMIINDIGKLIESINIIGNENINWILSNKLIKVNFDIESKVYSIEKINNLPNGEIDENNFIIDKTLIFKSFDVISYVMTKMYEEAFNFLNYDTETLLITLNF
jgi:hypothetical protein